MSYSFTTRAADKAAAKAAVAAEMAKIVETQPDHAADQAQAIATAGTFIDMLKDEPDMDITVSVYGSIGWIGQPSGQNLTATSMGVSAYYVMREQQTA